MSIKKKYESGLIPVDFKMLGKVLVPVGTGLILVYGIGLLVESFVVPKGLLLVGLGTLLVGWYLVRFVPES